MPIILTIGWRAKSLRTYRHNIMEINRFGVKSPGEIVSIAETGHAFVPDPLPPKWEFPVSLWPILADAKAKVALLEGVGRTLPNPALLLRPLASREAIQSS